MDRAFLAVREWVRDISPLAYLWALRTAQECAPCPSLECSQLACPPVTCGSCHCPGGTGGSLIGQVLLFGTGLFCGAVAATAYFVGKWACVPVVEEVESEEELRQRGLEIARARARRHVGGR